ncbi:gamma-secretase subunit pen-2 [Rhizophagus clarus]|uniref:Gamma-secretase subunit pen-2 n=1 Tax=Rhizophagus clarus TaxID=94130 RepID=A0A8H3QFZ2_9GLOM|nr:gamma-secretase subunit pen-2 [Rhizophagus clarus]
MPPNPSKIPPSEILSLYIGKEIKKYLYFSTAGALFWLIVLTTWYSIFVNQRITWGEFADKIIVIPIRGA